ncbi:hypothetical protein [Fervidibacillus albus]|uniref:Uncharacterized protein n=1 Tax=Fervidibacillus albus TaxID=2980026 RepID=A0A9E8RWT6_9BACI|nr:hypothetical protein [Fervidibacillus albus]WAA11026.1 hypothetical protein OE104_06890 [Fervidibacillus albus]
MNRMLRRFKIKKMVPKMMHRKRYNRNKIWLSLLGFGLAGSASVYMSKNKNNGMKKKMKQLFNVNMQGLKTMN